MMYDNRSGLLSLSPETGVCLLVQFQRPRHRVPDDGAASGLKVQTVTCGRWLYQGDRNLACIPVGNVGIGLDFPAVEPLHDGIPFMLVPVSNQGRLAVLCFQQIF